MKRLGGLLFALYALTSSVSAATIIQPPVGSAPPGITFPQAVTGANSGGVACATGSTTLTTSPVVAANAFVIGGGAGACTSSSASGTNVLTLLSNAANGVGGPVALQGAITSGNYVKWNAAGIQDGGTANAINGPVTVASALTIGNYVKWTATGLQDGGAGASGVTEVYAIATCGLLGNGSDESTGVQTCIDNHKGKRIIFDQGHTFMVGHLVLSGSTYNNTTIDVRGTMKLPVSGAGCVNYNSLCAGVVFENMDGGELIGNFDGNASAQPASEFIYNIVLSGATNTKIHDIRVTNIRGDGIYIAGLNWTVFPTTNTNGVSIHNAYFYNPTIDGRNAISLISGINVNLTNITSINVGGHINGVIEPGGIDIEPNFAQERVQNVSMSGINITCGGSSCLAIGGVGVFYTGNTSNGSAAITSVSSVTNVNPGDTIYCADGSGIPVGGATIFSVVGSTINLNPGEVATASATGTHCYSTPTTRGISISGATVVNNAPADTLDGNSAMTLAGARTLFIKDSSDVQVTGFNGLCGIAGTNCEPIVVKNGDRVVINASGVRNCEVCVTLVSNTDIDGTVGGVTNSDITVNCADIARSCFRIWRASNVRIGGVAEHPRAGSSFYPGGVFAYWMDLNTLNNVTFNVRIPYSPNWNLGFQGGATLNNVRVVNSDFGSGWALGTLRASFNNAVNIPFINSNGFNDVAAAPTPGAACGSTAAFDAGANSTYGVLTPGGTGITTGCTITFATGSKPAATAAYCTVAGLASTSTTTAITITPAVVSGTAYVYHCDWR